MYLHRNYKRVKMKQEVENKAKKNLRGQFIDPNLGISFTGKYDLGHKYGHEFWRERNKAEAQGLTQKQFNERMNNPKFYQIELPSSNRSHRFEAKYPQRLPGKHFSSMARVKPTKKATILRHQSNANKTRTSSKNLGVKRTIVPARQDKSVAQGTAHSSQRQTSGKGQGKSSERSK